MKKRKNIPPENPERNSTVLLEKIKRSYKSLLLGILSLAAVLFIAVQSFVPAKNQPAPAKSSTEIVQEETVQENSTQEERYIVEKGDNLWIIAEQYLGSGFRANEIAQANNIGNPDLIDIGQKLILPKSVANNNSQGDITETAASTQKMDSQEITYTVKTGDYLWKISQEVYGDGYQWIKIAEANNLQKPSVIHTGNVLRIPPKNAT